jgi:hypothetical protein
MKSGDVVNMPDTDDVLRMASVLSIHVGWSVFWDKRYGVWRVSEDDPDSDLYEENADAQRVIAYVAAHSRERAPARAGLDTVRAGPWPR